MTSLPTDAAIRARAEQLSLIEPGADLPHSIRKQVAKLLHEEATAPPVEKPADAPVLLSRLSQPAAGGLLQVDVYFIPNPTPGPTEGPTKG